MRYPLLNSTSAMDWDDVLATSMDHIADDFHPFDTAIACSGDTVDLPLFTGEIVRVSLSHGVQWDRKFERQAGSSVMHLFSLELVGKLLSTFQKRNDDGALRLAVVVLESFLNYSSSSNNQTLIGGIRSADHSAAARVRVLIKFIQLARDRSDVDHLLLQRACECLRYWSDWLIDPEHYRKNNHGLMGAIALLHSAVQFGSVSCGQTYLDVAIARILELGQRSFDADGLCNENTIGYHNYNVHCYREVLKFCKHYTIAEALIGFLEGVIFRATQALAFCVWQDGSIPPIGDSAIYRIKIVPNNTSKCFRESGFAVVKNDDLYLSIICGARTETHKQVDDMSVTLRYKNRDILIDGGSYTYDYGDPYRRCVESSFGHSGLFLKEFDGLLRKEFLHKFGPASGKIERFEESEDGVRIKCVFSVRDGGTVLVRQIFVCWPDEIAIVDSVESQATIGWQLWPLVPFRNCLSRFQQRNGNTPEPLQRFLFGSTLEARFEERNKLILTAADLSYTLFQLSNCDGVLYRGGDAGPLRGWFSTKYKEILPTYGVDFTQAYPQNRFSTIIKLAPCTDLSECSTAVREFASQNGGSAYLNHPGLTSAMK